mmetsp:Transcript_27487/g.43231  ORF Transcript_27487/g.43231 Transcript_27487/m.43231 type:complete len:372 (-) Transcript_27487:35-1150(-)
MAISASEAHYIIESCLTDLRIDGRSKLCHRPYTITNRSTRAKTTSNSAPAFILSNGSSRIHLPGSTTDVVCSVKADLVHPSPSKPNQGILELNVDLSLCGGGGTLEASGSGGAQKRRRQQREEESQITSLLQRLILPHAVNHESLVVWPGKYVWRLSIDVMVLRCDGCVLDASSIAIREALQNTKLPKVQAVMDKGNNDDATTNNNNGGSASKNDLLVDGDHHKAVSPLGAEECPLVITVSVLSSPPSATDAVTSTTGSKRYKSIAIIDARTEEEACASTRVCVTVDTNGMVCGVHTLGGGGAGMEEEEGEQGGGAGRSSMPISMVGEVVTTASMAAKNLYAKLDRDRQVVSSTDNDCGYGYLLKNHFLIQ